MSETIFSITNGFTKEPSTNYVEEFLSLLETRFGKNMHRHEAINWKEVEMRLEKDVTTLKSLMAMEETGGEPDVIGQDDNGEYIFVDCSTESPQGRRSLCYDDEALVARKENKPVGSAIGIATLMGVSILNEQEYRRLQELGEFDVKTSSWIQTPSKIRELGGAIFADNRYKTIFIYHNGAISYYAARGFRGILKV